MPRNIKHPDCCQARIFCSFGGHGSTYGHQRFNPVTEKALDEWLDQQIRRSGSSFFTVILNDRQNKLFKDVLTKHNFKVVSKTISGYTRIPLYYYLRTKVSNER